MSRMIDADAFDKTLEDAELEAKRNRKYVFASALNIIRGNLRNAPPIEERKTGKWIDINGWHKCSQCGQNSTGYNTTPYCPNCGADMR